MPVAASVEYSFGLYARAVVRRDQLHPASFYKFENPRLTRGLRGKCGRYYEKIVDVSTKPSFRSRLY